jgi:hypothetical protein
MTIIFPAASVIFLIAFAAYMLHKVFQTVPPSGWRFVDEIGIIERDLRNLKTVVVILDQIEKPYHLLLDAVLNNFSENVQYYFFVSGDHFASSSTHFKPFFDQLIQVASTIKGSVIAPDTQLCYIYNLSFNRNGYPYIFYCCANAVEYNGANANSMNIIAFRGCDKGRGIADQYRRVEADEARSQLELVFGMLPTLADIQLPDWLTNPTREEFVTTETPKLLEYRPAHVVNILEVQKAEQIEIP